MAMETAKIQCSTCNEEKDTYICRGCSKTFCFNHLTDHREIINKQFNQIEDNCNLFRQKIIDQKNDLQNCPFIKQIDQWENDSIKQIQQRAKECRQLILHHTTEHIHQIEVNLVKLTDQLRQTRKENDFNEIDLRELKQKLTQLTEGLDKPSNISIQHSSTSFIYKIAVVVSSGKCLNYIGVNGRSNF